MAGHLLLYLGHRTLADTRHHRHLDMVATVAGGADPDLVARDPLGRRQHRRLDECRQYLATGQGHHVTYPAKHPQATRTIAAAALFGRVQARQVAGAVADQWLGPGYEHRQAQFADIALHAGNRKNLRQVVGLGEVQVAVGAACGHRMGFLGAIQTMGAMSVPDPGDIAQHLRRAQFAQHHDLAHRGLARVDPLAHIEPGQGQGHGGEQISERTPRSLISWAALTRPTRGLSGHSRT